MRTHFALKTLKAWPGVGVVSSDALWNIRDLLRRRSKDDILSQIRDLQSEMARLESRSGSGPVEASNKSN